jgi:hypothetical protein
VQALNAVVDSGLRQIHVPLTALVKIRGCLIYVTSIAPLQQLVVGSDDAGSVQSHVHDGTEFPMARTLSMQLARILHLQPHSVNVSSTCSLHPLLARNQPDCRCQQDNGGLLKLSVKQEKRKDRIQPANAAPPWIRPSP